MARGHLANYRLIEVFSKYSTSSSEQQTDAQCDATLSFALKMLECDTKLLTSALTKGYHWFIEWYFPLPAYIHIVQDLRRRPANDDAEQIWKVMSDNYKARCVPEGPKDSPFFRVIAKVIHQAWETREALFSKSEKSPKPPWIVSDIREKLAQTTQDAQHTYAEPPSDNLGMSIDDFAIPMPMDFGGHGMLYGVGGQGYEGLGLGNGQPSLDTDVNQFQWSAMDWNSMNGRGW